MKKRSNCDQSTSVDVAVLVSSVYFRKISWITSWNRATGNRFARREVISLAVQAAIGINLSHRHRDPIDRHKVFAIGRVQLHHFSQSFPRDLDALLYKFARHTQVAGFCDQGGDQFQRHVKTVEGGGVAILRVAQDNAGPVDGRVVEEVRLGGPFFLLQTC